MMGQERLFKMAEDILADQDLSCSASMALAGVMQWVLYDTLRPRITDEQFRFLSEQVAARGTLHQFKGLGRTMLMVSHAEVFSTVIGLYDVHGRTLDWLVAHFDDLEPWFHEHWTRHELLLKSRERWELIRSIRDSYSGGGMLVPEGWVHDLEATFVMAMMAVMGEERYKTFCQDVNAGIRMMAQVKTLNRGTAPVPTA